MVAPVDPNLLGAGYRVEDDDVMGEQGLRLVLEQWTTGERARQAAAGWGGDALALVRCAGCGGGDAYAAVWRLVFDTERDANEVADLLRDRFGARCRERGDLGPIAWRQQGARVVLVAGPHVRTTTGVKPGATCAAAERWSAALVQEGASRAGSRE